MIDALLAALRSPDGDSLSSTLVAASMVFARVSPFVAMAVFFGRRQTAPVLNVACSVAIAGGVLPMALANATAPSTPLLVPIALLIEVVRGALFGFALVLPLFALSWAGRVMDNARGAANAESQAPLFGQRATPLEILYGLAGVAAFCAIEGHLLVLEALARTFESAPVGAAAASLGGESFLQSWLRLVTGALDLSVSIASPAIVALIAAELALGLLGRSAPQIPIHFVGMPLRSAAGVAVALVTLSMTLQRLPDLIGDQLSIPPF